MTRMWSCAWDAQQGAELERRLEVAEGLSRRLRSEVQKQRLALQRYKQDPRGGDVIEAHPRTVRRAQDTASIVIEMLAQDATERGDVAGSDAFLIAHQAMVVAQHAFAEACSQQAADLKPKEPMSADRTKLDGVT